MRCKAGAYLCSNGGRVCSGSVAQSIEICTLLRKRSSNQAEVPLRYVGAEIPDEYVVGYGLDYNENFRHLPHIAALDLVTATMPQAIFPGKEDAIALVVILVKVIYDAKVGCDETPHITGIG